MKQPGATVATELVLSAQTCPGASFKERLAAAAGAGYRAIGLRPLDLARARDEGLDGADAAALLASHGLRVVELEALFGWALDGTAAEGSRRHEERLYELSGALGGEYIIANSELPDSHRLAAERYAALCDRALSHGLRVAIEFLPWTGIPDVAAAWRLVEAAGRPNGGVLVDSWHLYRGGGQESDMELIPPERVVAIHLDDARAECVGTLLEDTLRRRELPGEGSFPLDRFFEKLAAMGVRAPVAVEVISDRMAALAPAESARLSAQASRRVLGL